MDSVEDIEKIYRNYEKNQSSHEFYFEERQKFFKNPVNQNKFKNDIELEFKQYFDEFLSNERNEAIDIMKKTVWCQNSKDSSAKALRLEARKKIKAEYVKYYSIPESHENYASYMVTFNTWFGHLKGVERANKWKKFWRDAMDKEFDEETSEPKIQKWIQKVKDAQNDATISKIVNQLGDAPTIDLEPEETIPRSKVEEMLENYDLRKEAVKISIREEFEEYLKDAKSYPFIEHEKKMFLKQQNRSGRFNEEDVLQFEDRFLEFWKDKVKILQARKEEKEVKKIRRNWQDLVVKVNDVSHEDQELKASSSEDDIPTKKQKTSKRQNIDDFLFKANEISTQTETSSESVEGSENQKPLNGPKTTSTPDTRLDKSSEPAADEAIQQRSSQLKELLLPSKDQENQDDVIPVDSSEEE